MYNHSFTSKQYYPTLDILRGFAICLVIFYHIFDSISFFRFGWMGVDLFFVLSGFLITDILLKSREKKFYFRNFYMRRILRIFPLYYLVLLLFFTLSPFFFSQKGPQTTFAYYNENSAWFWTYFQNWLMVWKGPPPVPFLSHFWSLAIEEQFYMFWPLLIFFFKRPKVIKRVIIVLIAAAIVIRLIVWMMYPHEVEKFFYSTFTRMDSLLMGCWLAVHLREKKEISLLIIRFVILCFVLLIALSLTFFGNLRQDNLLFPTIGYSLTAAFFTSLLYLFLKYESQMTDWLKHLNVLRFAGKISYGMYVLHIPIYLVLGNLLSRIVGNSWYITLINKALFLSALTVLLTVATSILCFRFIERPILSLKKHFP